jgi:hypothetical protein
VVETLPRLTLIWIYEGSDPHSRRETIETLDYPDVQLISPNQGQSLDQLKGLVATESEVCVFWADDDKPIGPDFLQRMVQPLLGRGAARAALHLWSGNAMAMPRETFDKLQDPEFKLLGRSFMRLALTFLDVGAATDGMRSQVEFSSIERVAPLCAEPVGLVC